MAPDATIRDQVKSILFVIATYDKSLISLKPNTNLMVALEEMSGDHQNY